MTSLSWVSDDGLLFHVETDESAAQCGETFTSLCGQTLQTVFTYGCNQVADDHKCFQCWQKSRDVSPLMEVVISPLQVMALDEFAGERIAAVGPMAARGCHHSPAIQFSDPLQELLEYCACVNRGQLAEAPQRVAITFVESVSAFLNGRAN